MAYIESELAKRRPAGSSSTDTATKNFGSSSSQTAAVTADSSSATTDKQRERQPATLGKIQEIDLGNEVRAMNAAQTERARRKLAGEEVEDEDAAATGKNKKVRLGRDGKPWRGRKRRNSEDIKRDALVEELLHENRSKLFSLVVPIPLHQNTLFHNPPQSPNPFNQSPSTTSLDPEFHAS